MNYPTLSNLQMQTISKLTSLKFASIDSTSMNPEEGQYLPNLPIPHPALSLSFTPPNPTKDLPRRLMTLNDPKVALNLISPPYPYTNQNAEDGKN